MLFKRHSSIQALCWTHEPHTHINCQSSPYSINFNYFQRTYVVKCFKLTKVSCIQCACDGQSNFLSRLSVLRPILCSFSTPNVCVRCFYLFCIFCNLFWVNWWNIAAIVGNRNVWNHLFSEIMTKHKYQHVISPNDVCVSLIPHQKFYG